MRTLNIPQRQIRQVVDASGVVHTFNLTSGLGSIAARAVDEFDAMNAPQRLFRDGGGVVVTSGALGGPEPDPLKSAEPEAKRLFALLVMQDWAHTIAKCRRCSGYFHIKKPRAYYKRGTFCSECRAKAHSRNSMAKKRSGKYRIMLQLAADARESWDQMGERQRKRYRGGLKSYVVSRVNKQLPIEMTLIAPGSPITVKWVTRNLTEIEKERSRGSADGMERKP